MDDDSQMKDDEIQEVIEIDDGEAPNHSDDDDDDGPSKMKRFSLEMEGEPTIDDDSLMALQAHAQDCFCIALAANRWLATGGEDDVAFIFDKTVSESDPVLKLTHNDSVVHAAFNNNETLLATADMGGHIIITELSTLRARADISECGDLEWVLWHTTADILFAGDKDGIMWMWLISNTGVAQSKVYARNGLACTAGCMAPDGRRMLAGYADGCLEMWNLREETSSRLSCNSPITCIHHHITQPTACVGTQDGTLYMVNTSGPEVKVLTRLAPVTDEKTPRKSKEVREGVDEEEDIEIDDIRSCIECVSMAPSHPFFATGQNDGRICIYQMNAMAPRAVFQGPDGQAIVKVIWSMEGNVPLLTCGSIDGTVRVLDSRDGSLVKEWGNGGDEVLDMLVIQSNPHRVMTAGSGGVVRLFELESGAPRP